MAVTVAKFTNAFPEFRKADSAEVAAKIGFATDQIADGTWGKTTDQGIMYLTAHLLVIAAQGQQARLRAENRATPYGVQYEILKSQVTFGLRTAGLPALGFQRGNG